MKVSKTGYKKNSKDKNEKSLLIPSNQITMKDVEFPVFGTDDTGYSQMMYPGLDYSFPGNYVYELPMAQGGGHIVPGRYRNPEGNWLNKYASGGDISIPDLSRSWLSKYQPGGQAPSKYDLMKVDVENPQSSTKVVVPNIVNAPDKADNLKQENYLTPWWNPENPAEWNPAWASDLIRQNAQIEFPNTYVLPTVGVTAEKPQKLKQQEALQKEKISDRYMILPSADDSDDAYEKTDDAYDQLMDDAFYNKVLGINYGSKKYPFEGTKDTLINLTNLPMGAFGFNTIPGEKYTDILGNNYVEIVDRGSGKPEDTAANWIERMKDPNDAFRNIKKGKSYVYSKDIPAFYGVENKKFKVGKATDFDPSTIIVPVRNGTEPYVKIDMAKPDTDYQKYESLYTYDKDGNKLWNIGNKEKFLVHSPETGQTIFISIDPKSGGSDFAKTALEEFQKNNPGAYIIALDEGRFMSHMNDPEGLSDTAFKKWTANSHNGNVSIYHSFLTKKPKWLDYMTIPVDNDSNPNDYGYNLGILKQKHGGWLDKYQPGGQAPSKYDLMRVDQPTAVASSTNVVVPNIVNAPKKVAAVKPEVPKYNKVPAKSKKESYPPKNYSKISSRPGVSGSMVTVFVDPKTGEEWISPEQQAAQEEYNELSRSNNIDPIGTAIAAASVAAPLVRPALSYLNAPAVLPYFGEVPWLTANNVIGAAGATDAMVNRFPEIPGQLSRGEYMDAAINALTGALDLYTAGMVSPLLKGAKQLPGSPNNTASKIVWPQRNSKNLLPELEPYLGQTTKPLSQEEQIFRSFLSPEERAKLAAADVTKYNPDGSIKGFIPTKNVEFTNTAKTIANKVDLPKGVSKEDLMSIIDKNLNWVKSDEYIARRIATTGETKDKVVKLTEKWIDDLTNNTSYNSEATIESLGTYSYHKNFPFKGKSYVDVSDDVFQNEPDAFLDVWEHEFLHGLSPALKQPKLYNDYPSLNVTPKRSFVQKLKDQISGEQKDLDYHNLPAEQQVRAIRLNSKIRKDLGIIDSQLTKEHLNKWFDEYYNTNLESLGESGFSDVTELLTRAGDLYESTTGTSARSMFLDWLNKAWSITPAAIGTGAAAVISGQDTPQQKYGGWLDKYQDAGQVNATSKQPFYESTTEPGTYETTYLQPEVTIKPKWTEAELERNRLRDKYIEDDKRAFRHWYDKLGYDRKNVDKRAEQYAYNTLAKQYLKGDRDKLTDQQKRFIQKSEYADRLQPTVGSRFVEGFTNPGFNLETLSNLAAPLEYPTNLVRGAVKGEFADAVKGYTPSPYFVSSDRPGTSPTEAAIMSGLVDAGVDIGFGALEGLNLADDAARAGKYLTTQTPLKNAYKYNPKALKEAQEAMLVRARPVGQDPYINMAENLRTKEAAGEFLKWYQKNLLNPQTNPNILAREKYYGQWFADNPSDLDFYINPATRNFADDAQIELLKARMPKSEAAKYNIKNFEDAKTLSNLHDSEYILPKDMVQQLERYPVDELPKLIEEYKQLNTPHWLKGYPEIPKELPGSPNVDQPIQQMGFFNTKGALQKYPKGKLTQEEIDAFKNSDSYKQSTKEHLELKNKYGDTWKLPNYADEALQEAIATGNRSRINPILYGGRNWRATDYIIAGLAGTAYPGYAGIMGLAFSPPVVKNKVLNAAGITSKPGVLSSKDTTINITNRPMDFAKVNETADGQVILGGEFIESTNNTVRKAKDWLTAADTYSDKEYPSKNIQSFYGIENGKFKVGKALDFKPNTEIVPRRFGESNISQAVLNEGAMRLLDAEGNPIYQNTPNTGKFILYSPSTKESEFAYINTGKSGVDKVNSFLKKNKDAQYIHLDNGRYEFYGLNPEGLTNQDFRDYYQQDLEREGNPGYNMIIKKYGGWLDNYKKGGVKSQGEGYYDYINGYSGIFAKGGTTSKENKWINKYK